MTKAQQAAQAKAAAEAAHAAVERAERALARAKAEAHRADAWAALTAETEQERAARIADSMLAAPWVVGA